MEKLPRMCAFLLQKRIDEAVVDETQVKVMMIKGWKPSENTSGGFQEGGTEIYIREKQKSGQWHVLTFILLDVDTCPKHSQQTGRCCRMVRFFHFSRVTFSQIGR